MAFKDVEVEFSEVYNILNLQWFNSPIDVRELDNLWELFDNLYFEFG